MLNPTTPYSEPYCPCNRGAIEVHPFDLFWTISSIALAIISILWMAGIVPIGNQSAHLNLVHPFFDGGLGLLLSLGVAFLSLSKIFSPRFRNILACQY